MVYTQNRRRVGPVVVQGEIKEELSTLPNSKKSRARKAINEEVFDVEDSVADNAKAISLVLTMMSRIYDIQTEAQKDLIPVADRALIEGTFMLFRETQTRADVQLAQEGFPMVARWMSRQEAVGEIVK